MSWFKYVSKSERDQVESEILCLTILTQLLRYLHWIFFPKFKKHAERVRWLT